jgi:hypothetical protein
MISQIQKPKTKPQLIKALQAANVASVHVYEGDELASLPSKAELSRRRASVVLLIPR